MATMHIFQPQYLFKLCLAGLLLGSAAAHAAEAGRIVLVAGKVAVAGHAGALNAPVQEGDELETGGDGYVYVKTVDQGFLILRPNSRARIITYVVDTAHPANTRVKLELTKGVARSISGQAVKQARQNFRFNTPVAAIGVRGTDFIVYTDELTSRVNVVSGGIVMSGFEGDCRAEGTGPCEGGSSRELFAGRAGALLQIERGKGIPQLLNNPALQPDQNEKPRSDEPVGKTTATASPVAEVNLDPQRSDRSLESVRVTATNNRPPVESTPVVVAPPVLVVTDPVPAPVTPAPVTPPVAVPVPPAVVVPDRPVVPEVFWGRWQSVAGYPDAPGRVGDSGMITPSFVGMYAITRVADSQLVMPKEGSASFKLADSEAMVQKPGGVNRIGKAESGTLDVNFVDRTFATALTIKADTDSFDIAGKGAITEKGAIVSNPDSSTLIRGFLGGPAAEQAGYIFRNVTVSGTSITGATSWTR
jgi:hypothetical protein